MGQIWCPGHSVPTLVLHYCYERDCGYNTIGLDFIQVVLHTSQFIKSLTKKFSTYFNLEGILKYVLKYNNRELGRLFTIC